MTDRDPSDPKRLIAESYLIEGITASECRSIFLDWALSLPMGENTHPHLQILLERHRHPDHPMTEVIRQGLNVTVKPRRRGGWRSRTRPDA
ncbi:MAG: hypothetical protein P8Q92_06095 [Pseudoprimorskyibacter sp.]|jgi:hypothetical protein|nr:hypothetical protein [Pseudoprimorskyibacter sp.]